MLYIDPGTGSLILQVVVAGVLAVSFTVKGYAYRIKRFVTGLFRRSDSTPQE